MLLSCFLLIKSLTIFLVPHWTKLYQFYINGFFNGFVTAAICVMVNVWLNELWSWSARQRSAQQLNGNTHHSNEPATRIDVNNVLMQALHFFFGVGCILGPLIATSFLRYPFAGDIGFWTNNLVTPYTIAASTALAASMLFFITFLFCPYQQPNKSNDHEADTDSGNGSDVTRQANVDNFDDDEVQVIYSSSQRTKPVPIGRWHFYAVIFASSIFIFSFICSEGTWFQFSATFSAKVGFLSQDSASLLASALAVSFTVFRGLSILIALKLTPLMMIYLDLIVVGVANTLVFIFVGRNLTILTLGYILLGAGFSSVFPSYFPYLECNGFAVTDIVGSLLTFSSGLGLVLAPYVIGIYIESFPNILIYITYASVFFSGIALTGLNTLIYWGKRKRNNVQQREPSFVE